MAVPIQHAQTDLLGLISQLPPGETLTRTDNDVPVATLVRTTPASLRPPRGCGM